MAELTFSLGNLPVMKQMPPVCARCGRAARSILRVRLKVPSPYSGPDLIASLAGVSDDDQRRWHDLQQMFAEGKGVVELPVCWCHRWILPPMIGVKSLTEHHVTLWGLGDSFVLAMMLRGC